LVLGLGNLLRRDEGLGIRALWRLQEEYALPESVQPLDGGTLGLELLSYLEEAHRVLVLDAALTDGPPGTLLRLAGDEVPAFLGMRTSPHEVGLADLLAVARLRGTAPAELVVLGMQPAALELGWELSPSVEAHLGVLVTAAARELAAWGYVLAPPDRGHDGSTQPAADMPEQPTHVVGPGGRRRVGAGSPVGHFGTPAHGSRVETRSPCTK
jgi:hydrogenase maturation protease